MPLNNFFSINMPYGMFKNEEGEWAVFNREYKPLGIRDKKSNVDIFLGKNIDDYPVFTKYRSLGEKTLLKLAEGGSVHRNDNGEINQIYFYRDVTNPIHNPKCWNDYFDRIKIISKFKKR